MVTLWLTRAAVIVALAALALAGSSSFAGAEQISSTPAPAPRSPTPGAGPSSTTTAAGVGTGQSPTATAVPGGALAPAAPPAGQEALTVTVQDLPPGYTEALAATVEMLGTPSEMRVLVHSGPGPGPSAIMSITFRSTDRTIAEYFAQSRQQLAESLVGGSISSRGVEISDWEELDLPGVGEQGVRYRFHYRRLDAAVLTEGDAEMLIFGRGDVISALMAFDTDDETADELPQYARSLDARIQRAGPSLGRLADIDGLERFPNLSRNHSAGPVTYPQLPPAGGVHASAWQNCGIYDQPVPNEPAVHSLEHGAVWITYRPNLPPPDVQALRALARGQDFVLLTPWQPAPALPSPVVASAWGLQLKLDNAADPRLAEFVRRYANGPQTPEPGAPCSGGVGTPVEAP